jgi:hypothetical protein
VLSPWHGQQLRIIPEAFWPTYLDFICQGITDSIQARSFRMRLGQICAEKGLDNHHRWDIPDQLAKLVGLISDDSTVVLLPCRFWLEVRPAKAWQAFLIATFQQARALDVPSADFEI